MPKVMISYRRSDSAGWAGWLHDRLAARFGEDDVFLDIDSIPIGADYLETIKKLVAAAGVVLVVMGPRWLTATDKRGRRCLDRDDDILRLELRMALEQDKVVIPVLFDNAIMPEANELPEDMRLLAFRNPHDVAAKYFRRDVDALSNLIETEVNRGKRQPLSIDEQIAELREKLAVAEQALREEQREARRLQQAENASPVGVASGRERLPPQPEYHASRKPFDAFLSYNHATDGQFAASLQTALVRIGKPWYKVSELRVFREASDLTAAPKLWASIQTVLDSSESMILLASPAAAASQWVTREVDYWLTKHGAGSILIVLTDGTIQWNKARRDFDWTLTNALPPILRGHMTDEPVWLDLRWATDREMLTLDNPRFASAAAQLAAALSGRSVQDVAASMGDSARSRARMAGISVFVLLVLFVYSIWVTLLLVKQ